MDRRPPPRHARAVAALVATRGRLDLLRQRALPSVLAQSRRPDRLLIVIDQSKAELPDPALKELAASLQSQCGADLPVTVLRNRRTPGRAAGAWNTGIDQLHRDARIVAHPELWFVAVLDDDDAWSPDHLQLCSEEALAGDLGMVASGLIRHESPDDAGRRQTIPEKLDAREQFIRGQHIQGSNLFVRLDQFLLAGKFDERLPSCTDRDLCIRLALLPGLRFGANRSHTVHHYADGRPDRLSSPASPAKLDGLTRLWHKHADRFDAAARSAAAERASELFGWRMPTPSFTVVEVPELTRPAQHVQIVAGFVTDASAPPHSAGLLEDLLELSLQPGTSTLGVVVVENGPLPTDGQRPLQGVVEAYRSRGLDVQLVTIEQQREDWAQGRLVDTPDPTRRRLPIAVSRTVLNTYVAREASRRPGAVAWILDDDKRLRVRIDRGDGSIVTRPSPDLAALCALRDVGVDVVIGPDTDAAPLPFIATLRVQLVDLEHTLGILGVLAPQAPWPDHAARDAAVRAAMPDSYYDLSKFTEHLETPFSIAPGPGRASAADVLESVAGKVDRLLAGEAVFRPLAVESRCVGVDAAVESVQRGGSAIFFRPEHLLEYPQTLARFGERYVRRSDMIISQLMRDQLGLKIVMHAAAGVRHDRSGTSPARLDDATLWEDVLGYALYRAANDLMQQRSSEQRREPLLAWSPQELREAVRRVRKYIDERLAALTLNAWRIHGLAESIRVAAQAMQGESSRWSGEGARDQLARIGAEMVRISSHFKPSAVAQFGARIRSSVSDADIRNTFSSMDGLISEYRATCPTPTATDGGVCESRERRARALLRRAYGARSLRLLGAGGEGVVLTDELRVYKVLDLLKRRPNHDTMDTLIALSNRTEQPRYLYPLARVEERDGTLLVVYPYEQSEPYTGGRGIELIGLLRECKSSGIVFRNMHPKNLRVSPTGLKLIDYGSDIRPFSEAGYRSMAERAWLSWRWPHRADLDGLMRRALLDKSLPELDGFERFWHALTEERPSATRMAAGMVDPVVLQSDARRVLDYGCGKKARSARRFADAGLECVGFDPGPGVADRWATAGPLPPGLILTVDRAAALAGAPFDAVVCSLVLCELGDGPEYEQVLRDLRSAVRDCGLVVVTVCNPFATFGGPTSLHRRRDLPAGASYEETFWYTENAETGCGRREFHRPLSRLERDLLRHGLLVERRLTSATADTERFEPASDFMTLVCRPSAAASTLPAVSLVIKACAMESAALERQVTHLVGQLEGPRVFTERVLAIDSRRDGFVRSYVEPDWVLLQNAAERLLRRGVIDRVVQGPGAGPESRRVLRSWFDIDSDHTHSAQGAPLAAPLLAIESCSVDYVLQVDSDLLISRRDPGHDYLGEMIAALESSPAAVTVSLNVPQAHPRPFTAVEHGSAWRVEVRGCLLHRARLMAARPFPNEVVCGAPQLSWHRSVDRAAATGRVTSLRGGGAQTAFIHPPNEFKRSVPDWMLLLDLVEKGCLPPEQLGKVDLVGGPLQWVPRGRAERYIFVITGRDVPPGRMMRCLESLAALRRTDWGAVVVDDGSSELCRESVRLALEPWRERVTLLQPRERRGQLANMILAIRHVCTDPDSVIVTLDLDDALLGSEVLDVIDAEYLDGADATVGSMLRTDKHKDYPAVLEAPRMARGGNVWQHLRTFRKSLFDAIPDHELRLGARYVDIAVDWSFMIPVVEMAERPVWIQRPLYLYEPSGLGKGHDREERERQIGQLMARPPRRAPMAAPPGRVLAAEQVTEALWGRDGGILFLRHGERPSFAGLNAAQKDAVTLTDSGRAAALQLGRALGERVLVVSSPVLRAAQTAAAITEANGPGGSEVQRIDALVEFRIASQEVYEEVKRRLGWSGLMTAWMDGSLSEGVLIPCHEVARRAVEGVVQAAERAGCSRVAAVTHDFLIMALLSALRGVRVTAVPYLGSVFVDPEESRSVLALETAR